MAVAWCFRTGDYVYLAPADGSGACRIGQIESAFQTADGSAAAAVRWYFRPADLDLGSETPVRCAGNEVFRTDEVGACPLDDGARDGADVAEGERGRGAAGEVMGRLSAMPVEWNW